VLYYVLTNKLNSAKPLYGGTKLEKIGPIGLMPAFVVSFIGGGNCGLIYQRDKHKRSSKRNMNIMTKRKEKKDKQ
jgi:hypothetical protein